MGELRCPCGGRIQNHFVWAIGGGGCRDDGCECELAPLQAYRAAHRKAAAVSILAMHNNASINIHCVGYYSALRDLGVLAENETPDDLIAEIRAQGEA